MVRILAVSTILALGPCSPASGRDFPLPELAVLHATGGLSDGQSVELNVWVRAAGELMLFDSPKARRLGLVFPYCVSAGLAPHLRNRRPQEFDGKQLRVKGTLLRYRPHADRPDELSTMSIIDGMAFKNWCFGPYVLRIDSVVAPK